ncbi:MAG: formate--tetrahydrofolate ligase [Deltaproteobacteria bacterium]|nr:formate--tetrahydrofolate ligase [Deltaproteobacteria bacterium]
MPLTPDAIADTLDIPADARELRGRWLMKVDPERITAPERGRVVLVTAMTPTPAGEGKTTTVIGLLDALRLRGVRAVGALREPSLGPVFGAKGGAVGGGRARVLPEDSINLHFTGDIHAVTAAHNLLAAMVDNHLFHAEAPRLAPEAVRWGRAMDMNDRALRSIEVGFATKKGPRRKERFDITAASEVMAILCMSRNVEDLRRRLDRIIIGLDAHGKAVTAGDLKAGGPMAVLLLEATRPNLVQTLEGNPVFIHGGPFGNVAQGTSTLMQTQLARRLADVVITEAGFAFDLGGFKFLDLKARAGGFRPAAVVQVVTVRALRFHGGKEDFASADVAAVRAGLDNVLAHVEAMERLGLDPPIIAVNRYPTDSPEELAAVRAALEPKGCRVVEARHFGEGGAGALDLADAVSAHLKAHPEDSPRLRLPYDPSQPVPAKVEAIARTVFGATGVEFTDAARKELAGLEAAGLTSLPVCMAKTHLSISDRAEVRGRPAPYVLKVTGMRVSQGAGFLVALCGSILTMPGLHEHPAAENMDISRGEDGQWRVTGLH